MGDLGVVPTWIPLLLSAPSGTSVQSERAGTGDCNLSEDHPGSETGCKRTTETGRTLHSILYQTNGASLILGRMHFFLGVVRLTHPCWIRPDGGRWEVWISQRSEWNCRSIMERVKKSYRKGSGICREAAFRWEGNLPTAFLTGHRGTSPSRNFLTRLDEMEKGDYFFFPCLK